MTMYNSNDHRRAASYGSEDSFKVLVLGDSGVGKTTLVHAFCHDEVLQSPMPTIGCNVQVRLHSSTIPSAATATNSAGVRSAIIPSLFPRSNSNVSDPSSDGHSHHQPKFIEFYDVTGSPSVRDPSTRNMFYRGTAYQGIILVHDLCNRRSYDNLWKWIGSYLEISSSPAAAAAGGSTSFGYGGGNYGNQLNIPLLVVGTKTDMVASGGGGLGAAAGVPGAIDLVQKYGGEAVSVCTVSPAEFMPNSSASIAFNMFLNQVVDPTSSSTLPRSRTPSNNQVYGRPMSPSPVPSPSRITTTTTTTTRPPPTPTPTQQDRRRQQYSQQDEDDSQSPVIPIMDFATFTGGSGGGSFDNTAQSDVSDRIPSSSSASSSSGFSSHPLRAQYERNRALQGQYSNMSVPVYTQPSASRGHTPSGSR
ncbi:Rab-like protein 3 [Gryganskiella cystojenkinii]|nr:Rab-like protein 3 [Gryganskiella cystojenkinii]